MEASRLKLEHYNLLEVHLEPVVESESTALGSYANFEEADFESHVGLQDFELPSGEKRFTVQLRLRAGPKEGSKNFPYKFEVAMLGIFDGSKLPEEKREQLVAVNGASLLYSSARELLISLTSRSVGGAVLLPTVQFTDVAMDIEKKRLAAEPVVPVESQAPRLLAE